MRIAFPYPTYWPYMRRGAERCIHDLSTFLASRGHDVHIITSTPGRPRVAYEGDVKVTYLRQVSHPLMYRYAPSLRVWAYAVDATRLLLEERPDVAHMWSFSGIGWAPLLREMIDLPFLLHIIMRNHYWPNRFARLSFARLVRAADRVVALTQGGADAVAQEHGVDCGVLPPPVDMDVFRPCAPTDVKHPIVLCPADLVDIRKGGGLLLKAWNRVHQEVPEAVLVLAGPVGLVYHQGHGATVLAKLDLVHDEAARAAIEMRVPGDTASLPMWYSQASVTVLPSVEEAFGMVLTESLACGTPVVASAHDGPGEIVTNRRIGATVDLKHWADLDSTKLVNDLAEAILHGIELSRSPGTVGACREWASQWSIERVGLEAERLLERIVDERRTSTGRLAVP